MRRVLVLALFATACGGGASSTPAKNAGGAGSGANAPDDSVSKAAVAQGGVFWTGDKKGGAEGVLAGTLHAEIVDKDSPVKMDGLLKEWPARAAAKRAVQGKSAAAITAAIQYDGEKIWIGAEVTDEQLARTARFGESEDHASLVLAIPTGAGSFATYEIGLFAGKPGESAGSVRFLHGGQKGHEVPGSKIVEAPVAKGYSFEAVVPWSTFPEARLVRLGLRGVVRYYDSDGAQVKAVVATGDGDASNPTALPSLPTQAELSLAEGLLAPKGWLDKAPKFEFLADVAGDAMKEKVALYDRVFVIYGPSYRDGKQFFYRDVNSDVLEMAARDVTGRGKDDIVIRRRFSLSGGATREWFEVWSCLQTDEPSSTFGHEILVASGGKKVTNAVRASSKEIEIATEPPAGWDVQTYREPTTTDVEPILLPWGAVKSRTFHFEGNKFVKYKQVDQAPAAAVQPEKGQHDTLPDPSKQPPTPPVKQGGDLSAQMLDTYRRDRSVGAEVKPKVDLQVHVAEDPRPERVLLVGKDIVVFGPGFKGGSQYAYITLSQFSDAADISDLTARDLNGDGAADLVVRGVRHVTPPGAADKVEVESMFVYDLRGGTINRVFSIETAREQGGKRIQGLVQFIPSRGGKSFEIDVRPGLAKGWTEKTYPWPQEQPGGSMEPLLLPWGGIPSLRYTWNGTQFSR